MQFTSSLVLLTTILAFGNAQKYPAARGVYQIRANANGTSFNGTAVQINGTAINGNGTMPSSRPIVNGAIARFPGGSTGAIGVAFLGGVVLAL